MYKPIYLNNELSIYEISDSGVVRNIKRKTIVMAHQNWKGYLQISLTHKGKTKKYLVHRLVLIAFNPIKEYKKYQVNHEDGDKRNNHVSNLTWCTNKENMQHASVNNLHSGNYGSNNGSSKYDEETVRYACELKTNGYKNSYISNKTGISMQMLLYIFKGKHWRHIGYEYGFSDKPIDYHIPEINSGIRQEVVEFILNNIEMQVKEICENFEILYSSANRSAIDHIKRKIKRSGFNDYLPRGS